MSQDEKKQGPIDFAIVTALRSELEAVKSRLDYYEISRLRGREVETLALDFTDLVAPNDTLVDPQSAAQRIANSQGALFPPER